ncbi:TatD related DNase, putative [Angomonas deanei]|uniref:TatD related DNase, putative n=1 Tax=Angomonas deanei TaxID=59799 RepID=A0A7G2C6R7_9TRYP|nr:TatD related DNase, putative [Angomonas deanei]
MLEQQNHSMVVAEAGDTPTAFRNCVPQLFLEDIYRTTIRIIKMRSACLIDVALNLTDCVFHGVDWKGKRLHDDDFEHVLSRAASVGVETMIITGTSLAQSVKAVRLCRKYKERGLRCTVGVHPAHASEFSRPLVLSDVESFAEDESSVITPKNNDASFSPEEEDANSTCRLEYLEKLIRDNKDVVVAVGEIGIDYAELSYCPRETQETYFIKQLDAFSRLGLPFLLHSRECGDHFTRLLGEWMEKQPTDQPPFCGVVHSFNGSPEEQRFLLEKGLFLSINGSAFRERRLAEQVCQIPLDRLMFETDAPWCDIRNKDYGFQYVKTQFPTTKKKKPLVMGTCLERRNEPCHMVQVVEVFTGCYNEFNKDKPITQEAVMERVYHTTNSFFHLSP